jgi:hypothetical protein
MSIDSKLVAVTLTAAMLGCADDEVPLDEPDPICKKKSGCDSGGEASNDEVGDGDADGDVPEPGDEDYEYCSVWSQDGVRTVHQCEGEVAVSIEFDTVMGNCAAVLGESSCTEEHQFGAEFDPYSMPAVMACCDAEGTPGEVLAEYCAMDMVEQVCLSLPARIKATLAMGIPKDAPLADVIETQAENLMWWLNDNTQKCYDALHKPSNTPGVIGPVSWLVNGGENKNWSLLNNLTVTLAKGVVESTILPESGQLTCDDTSLNDEDVQEERGAAPPTRAATQYDLVAGVTATIDGPDVHGSAQVVDRAFCTVPRCSTLVLGDELVVEDLNIYADGPTVFDVAGMALTADQLGLRLYGAAQATPIHANNNDGSWYVIAPGAARFRVIGAFGAMSGTRWAENLDPIRLHETSEGWIIDDFTVGHVDGRGGTWNATIPATTWR